MLGWSCRTMGWLDTRIQQSGESHVSVRSFIKTDSFTKSFEIFMLEFLSGIFPLENVQ